MKVRIAFVTDVDGQPDIARIGTIEDHPGGDAGRLIKDGIAAEATPDEIADWDAEQARRDEAKATELDGLKKAELLAKLPDGVDVPGNATKDQLVAAIIEAGHQPTAEDVDAGATELVTSVAPGVMEGDPGEDGPDVNNTPRATSRRAAH